MEKKEIGLSILQKLKRAYGIWWDMFNTGSVVLILAFSFVTFSLIIVTGRVELLPFQDTVWKQFLETVPPDRQSEIGLGLLSVSVSATSAAALYLIRIGTIRWANNRRIGFIHRYLANELLLRCSKTNCCGEELEAAVNAFLEVSMKMFEQISETHPIAQYFYERARIKAHLFLREATSTSETAKEIAIDLFAAALVCQKTITIDAADNEIATAVEDRLATRL